MIFYFSGTGNTRWAAEQLAAATQEKLYFIPDELKTACEYTLEDDERIGICFPIHGWQPPHIVRQFIRRLTLIPLTSNLLPLTSHYAYCVCTCGDSTGLAVKMLSEELQQKGIALQSCLSLVMPESYVCLPFMYTDTPKREQEKIAQAQQDLSLYINKVVKNRTSGYQQLTLGLTPWTFSHVIGAYFNRFMITDKKFTVDADVCTHCGKCAKVCPVGDIVFSETPKWKNDGSCTCCLSCYHHCPVHAINYGPITRKRGQYYFGHH